MLAAGARSGDDSVAHTRREVGFRV
jgi:hypothetical protein